ncbi:hypothetical protein TNCV_4428231 [Trichonephila clavipes]|nr:hypothetical protein TNCV_4428231 [Trichonephila clavipes]
MDQDRTTKKVFNVQPIGLKTSTRPEQRRPRVCYHCKGLTPGYTSSSSIRPKSVGGTETYTYYDAQGSRMVMVTRTCGQRHRVAGSSPGSTEDSRGRLTNARYSVDA